MARIVVFASSKGGTGKSTVVANLGAAMAQLGRKVVLLDADLTMASLGFMLGLEGRKTTLHDILAGKATLSKVITTGPGGVKVVTSGISLEGIRRARLEGLKKVVSDLDKKFKFVLIDSPSGLDRDAIAAMSIAREMVLVVTPDIVALSNALKTKLVAERLNVKPIGTVITMSTDKNVDVSTNEIEATLELPVLAVIPEDPEMRRSSVLGEPVVTQSPKSPSASEFKRFAAAFSRFSGD